MGVSAGMFNQGWHCSLRLICSGFMALLEIVVKLGNLMSYVNEAVNSLLQSGSILMFFCYYLVVCLSLAVLFVDLVQLLS